MRRAIFGALLGIGALIPFGGPARAAPPPEAICSSPNTVLCSGFEEGSFSNWDDYDGNPAPWNSNVADPGPLGLSDNHATRMRIPPGRGGTDLTKVLSRTYDKLYVRYYQKWEPGYDFSARNHGGGLHAGDRNLMGHSDFRPTGADWYSAWLEPQNGRLNLYVYYRGMYQDCSNPSGACWGDHFPCFLDDGNGYCTKPAHRERQMPPLLQTGRWYCLEYMLDAGSAVSNEAAANGSLNLWIDGVEYGPFNQLWFRTTPNLKLSIFSIGIFHHGAHSVEGTMFDNLVVSTERIGCLDTGASRPNPPTEVHAE